MAHLDQMLEIGGTIEGAEKIARDFCMNRGPEYLLDLQLLLSIQGKHDEAQRINDIALEADPNDVRAIFNRGWMQLREGDFSKGIENMNAGRLVNVWGNGYINTDKPVWNGQKGRVLYSCEAGFGDEIIFIRFVKDIVARGASVVVVCSESLIPLFQRVQGVTEVVSKERLREVEHDYWLPSMAAPIPLGLEYKDLSGAPYITPHFGLVEKYRKILGNGSFKVGIRWRGLPDFERDQYRKFPKELLFDVVDRPGVQAFSLQRDLDYRPPEHVVDLEEYMTSWEHTAAIIANLDLVITSCTAIAHLAAAMGTPTWVLVPVLHYFTWAPPGERSPWYDSIRVIRQERFGSWVEPFNKIAKRLDM